MPFHVRRMRPLAFPEVMIDIWQSIVSALEVVVMLPSLVQAILPSLSSSSKLNGTTTTIIQQNVRRTRKMKTKRDMETFLREVETEFQPHLQLESLLAMSRQLQEEFREKLQKSEISMLPSFNHVLPTGKETGTYMALDVGGSTFRVALVELKGQAGRGSQPIDIMKMRSFKIDNAVRALKGQAFFDWMAARIEDTLEGEKQKARGSEPLMAGLAWSFPIEQTSIHSGKLLKMGKGFSATHGVLGDDLGELIMQACRKRNLHVVLDAIVNDASAALLSQAYVDPSTRAALILGTGTNAALHLPTSAFAHSKFGIRPDSWYDEASHVVVNTEYSMFGRGVWQTTRWDEYLNSTHTHPDFQPTEYLVSGRYLGEIVRLVLVEAIQTAGLFGGFYPDKLLEPYAFDTGILAVFESDTSPTLQNASDVIQKAHPMPLSAPAPAIQDLLFIRLVTQLVSQRAAAYLATATHALWSLRTTAEGIPPQKAEPMVIACNGSVIEKYPGLRVRCQGFLDQLVGMSMGRSTEGMVRLELAQEAAVYGAAVAASCAAGR